jgi:hypothetical protein
MALFIKVAVEPKRLSLSRERGFQFEEMWMRHDSHEEAVTEAWSSSDHHCSDIKGLWNILKDVSGQLRRWSYNTSGLVQKEVKRLRVAFSDDEG